MKNIYVIIALLGMHISLIGLVDLEDMAQEDMVLMSKQIILAEYPHAFNPSIIRWHGKLLMCFRVIPNPKQPFTSWLGLVWLDDDFNPISTPQQLELRDPLSAVPSRVEDGRLIAIGNRLVLVYSDNEDEVITKGGFRVYMAMLEDNDEGIFTIVHKERFSIFEGNDPMKREKNWVPFDYMGQLLLSYSLEPHCVFAPIFWTGICVTLASSGTTNNAWQWGELRGGTPALRQDDHYLGFFHSCVMMESVHCARRARHYFMGAYICSAEMPFTITHISNAPIIGKNFYHGASYPPYWGSVQVVFPGGFVTDDNYIWIVFGRQDHEMWVTQVDKKKVYENLIPIDAQPVSPNTFSFDRAVSDVTLWDEIEGSI